MSAITEYVSVQIEIENPTENLIQEISDIAISDYGAIGCEEFTMNEETIDEILKERAFSAGDVDESVINIVEGHVRSSCIKFLVHFSSKSDAEVFERKCQDKKWGLHSLIYQEDKDWNEEWRKNYKRIEISSSLAIVPSWEKPELPVAGEIYIYPGMGFGTGTHETTSLCLQIFDQITSDLPAGSRCLDFGCGSGILGLAAIKLKSVVVDFVDVDPLALDNCVQNFSLNYENSWPEGHEIVLRERMQDKRYDLIFANILQSVLMAERDEVLDRLNANGFLIISGLLKGQEQAIIESYGMNLVDTKYKGDWVALLFKGKRV
jgi:ribosomal protein L11 methyltransferase